MVELVVGGAVMNRPTPSSSLTKNNLPKQFSKCRPSVIVVGIAGVTSAELALKAPGIGKESNLEVNCYTRTSSAARITNFIEDTDLTNINSI